LTCGSMVLQYLPVVRIGEENEIKFERLGYHRLQVKLTELVSLQTGHRGRYLTMLCPLICPKCHQEGDLVICCQGSASTRSSDDVHSFEHARPLNTLTTPKRTLQLWELRRAIALPTMSSCKWFLVSAEKRVKVR
jgi:hypothetical protein